MLQRQEHQKAYLPPEIAVDYPTVENQYLPMTQNTNSLIGAN
jgi:hypothetical protein